MKNLLLCFALLLAGQSFASASFNNRYIGLSVGYTSLNARFEPVKSILPISLEAGFYIDSGFEAYLRVPLNIAYSEFGVAADGSGGWLLGTGGQLGLRYLFSEEDLRPWVGLHVSGIYFFREAAIGAPFLFGPGVNGGIEYFVGESISIGARGFADFFIELNKGVRFSVGGAAYVSVYF
jgi:outer membrane protein